MTPENEDLTAYYAKRAAEYEAIYAKPERQTELKLAAQWLQDIFREMRVLEIACGTGYWTPFIAETAIQVLATDINESVLEIARSKQYPRKNVRFLQSDLYELPPNQDTNALFGGFIWSHIKREDLLGFLAQVNQLVPRGSTIVFMDNQYVPGSSTPIESSDAAGNTFQRRQLKDGQSYLVLKNFPGREELESALEGKAYDFQYTALQYFWICAYKTI